jgi:hypothetical protein
VAQVSELGWVAALGWLLLVCTWVGVWWFLTPELVPYPDEDQGDWLEMLAHLGYMPIEVFEDKADAHLPNKGRGVCRPELEHRAPCGPVPEYPSGFYCACGCDAADGWCMNGPE